MSQMRFTIIDAAATVTFLGPPHALKALAAGCANGAESTSELLAALARYDGDLSQRLRDQLVIYREHNVAGETAWIDEKLVDHADYPDPVVVLNEATRDLSQRPGPYGLVIFNLPSHRIVQVTNTYATLERSDRGRVRRNGMPVRALYTYTLPDDWTIVP